LAKMTCSNQAVFVLTSNGSDIYWAMTRIAIASLRLTNPGLRILVACDHVTHRTLKSQENQIISEVDEWRPFMTLEGSPVVRNRFLKTSLRGRLSGNFLFLDSDILVRGDLSTVFATQADVAGAVNHSRSSLQGQIGAVDREVLDQLQWSLTRGFYINGGVLFYNDTRGAHEFGRCWHELWLGAYRKLGKYRDQTALNYALERSGARFHLLADRFNGQFWGNPSVVKDALIWHFYLSSPNVPQTPFLIEALHLIATGELRLDKISAMIRQIHPWKSQHIIDDWVANRLIQKQHYDGWEGDSIRMGYSRAILRTCSKPLDRFSQKLSWLGRARNRQ
jgi:hypothetical protein